MATKKNDNDFGILVGSIFINSSVDFCFQGWIYVEAVPFLCLMYRYCMGTLGSNGG